MRTGIAANLRSALLLSPLVGLLAWAGCGGSSSPSTASPPSGSTPTPPPVPEVPVLTDGWTEQSVDGEAEPPMVIPGHGVVARATGYLPREQVYVGDILALWPGQEDYVSELVYESWEFGDGSLRMVRWTAPFVITLEGDLATDDAAVGKALEVADELSRRTGMAVSVGPDGACRVNLDPSIADKEAVGLTALSFRGAHIVGATVSLVDRTELLGSPGSSYRNTFLHEMGHVVGLGHSPVAQDVMTPAEGSGTDRLEFREPEAVALHMMYVHREPGNRPPDRDEGLLATAAGSPITTVISGCRPPVGPRR